MFRNICSIIYISEYISVGRPWADWRRPWGSLFLPPTALSCILRELLCFYDLPAAMTLIDRHPSVTMVPDFSPDSILRILDPDSDESLLGI